MAEPRYVSPSMKREKADEAGVASFMSLMKENPEMADKIISRLITKKDEKQK